MKCLLGALVYLNLGSSIALLVVVLIAILIFWVLSKMLFRHRVESWPACIARIENVYATYLPRGNRPPYQKSNVILAYSYSVGDVFCSGKIRLTANDSYIPKLEREIIGRPANIRYNPTNPQESIFLEDTIENWPVVEDFRVSAFSWLVNYLSF